MKALWLLCLLARPALSQTTVVGDAWVLEKMGVGTTTPSARLDVQAASITLTAFQVSGVDETPFLTVTATGAVGLGLNPSASLDMNGSADSGIIGLQLRSGNLYPATDGVQIAFGHNGSANLRHAIKTIHSTSTESNAIDFLIWNTALSTTAMATTTVVSLVTISSSLASVHVRPIGTPDVELEVSNGLSTGGGAIHRAAEGVHSSRELKTDISYLDPSEEIAAYQNVQNLKHASFRYKSRKGKKLVKDSRQRLMRGLIYEETPPQIRGAGRSVILDERVTDAELAMKELLRRLEGLQARLEPGK